MMFDTAILFLIFNRPDTTEQVFNAIRKIQPKRLYVACDGARANKSGEQQIVEQTRKIIEKIDWECELQTLYRENNLGCKVAVSSAIDWFFEHEDEGIILEDDCLPNMSFFHYCKQMLQAYRHDTRVWHISGVNFQQGITRGNASYYFSKYSLIWGWATWKRAWQHYDVKIASFPEFAQTNMIEQIFDNQQLQKHWLKQFQLVHENKLDTWDHQWSYTLFAANALCITPNVNLITNIGFDERATHTLDAESKFANMPSQELSQVTHTKFVIRHREADKFSEKHVILPPIKQRIIITLGAILRAMRLIK